MEKNKTLQVKEATWADIMQCKFENRHVFGSVDELLSFTFKNIKKLLPDNKKETKEMKKNVKENSSKNK